MDAICEDPDLNPGFAFDALLADHRKWGFNQGYAVREAEENEALKVAVERLEKIADYSTASSGKYNSFEDGWYGVADFAKETLATIEKLRGK